MIHPATPRKTLSDQMPTEARTRIILVRHGHVEGITPPSFRGRTDLLLTEQGIRQAEMTGAWLAKVIRPDAIYTSPLSRCMHTAEVIARAGAGSILVIETFTDIDYGEWQGRSQDEVRASDPEDFTRWCRTPHMAIIPGGESLHDVAARVALTARTVLDRHRGGTVVLVGHDGVNRLLLLLALDLPLSRFWHIRQDPCGISILDHDGEGGWVVQSINETMHLRTE